MNKLYTIAEAAEILCVSKAQIYIWVNTKKLHGIRLGGPKAHVRFKESEMEKFIASGTPTSKIENYSKELNQLAGNVKSREDLLLKIQAIAEKHGFKFEWPKEESAASGTPAAKRNI